VGISRKTFNNSSKNKNKMKTKRKGRVEEQAG
jgi:hypothetical protein